MFLRRIGHLGFVYFMATAVFAGFASTETFLPAVGRVPGKNGAQFYTTIWATNLTTAPQTFTFRFLKAGHLKNNSPATPHAAAARFAHGRVVAASTG
jgi:hypothetical protein